MEDLQNEIIVSISCLTYNHGPYIRQCLDGFMMQQCDFKFEVLINDDASTDGTQEIIKEFQEKYPDIIKPIFQKENQYSKKIGSINAKFNFPRAKGKYIALCEGDDYWTDPLKLQKQVDFLEKNPEFSMVFSNADVVFQNDGGVSVRGLNIIQKSRIYSGPELLDRWTVPTASVLFKKAIFKADYEAFGSNKNFQFGDIVLYLYLSTKGKIYGMEDYMVSYRRHSGGVTNTALDIEYYRKNYIHLKEIIKTFGNIFATDKTKRMLADYALSLSIHNLAIKKQYLAGVGFLLRSVMYDPSFFLKYVGDKMRAL